MGLQSEGGPQPILTYLLKKIPKIHVPRPDCPMGVCFSVIIVEVHFHNFLIEGVDPFFDGPIGKNIVVPNIQTKPEKKAPV